MAYTIWKFPLNGWTVEPVVSVEMPTGAVILHADVQDEVPTVWAEVDRTAPNERRTFEVFGTGWPIRYDTGVVRKHIGSCFSGSFVWHIYERL